jgi:S1-C subfamily serine protease
VPIHKYLSNEWARVSVSNAYGARMPAMISTIRMIMTTAFFLSLFLLSFCGTPVSYAGQENDKIDTQVVAVFATTKVSSYFKPWKSPNFQSIRGSGFFFEDTRNFPGMKGLILTNAHVAAMAETVDISNGREKKRYGADPLGICNFADFAVLRLRSEELEEYESRNGRIVPLQLGDSDRLRVGDKVLGWGYPLGGERISKSEQGEINRIEVRRYAYSNENWLMVQASLQQNPGNSGGPILKDEKVVGIAFQGVAASDRINYFIPINLVKHLLPLLDKQQLIPRWQFFVQEMSRRLKDYYNLGPAQEGILLNSLIPGGGPEQFGLRANDILLEIDGHPIDSFGDIWFRPIEQRIYFQEVINRKKVGDPLTIKVLRDANLLEISGETKPGRPVLVPKIFSNADFLIYGGIGFVELSSNAIATLGKAGTTLREQYLTGLPKRPYEKIVIIAEIFPEYELVDTGPFVMERAEMLNDIEILNIKDLNDMLESLKAQGKKKALIHIGKNRQLPLDLHGAEELDKKIQQNYGILYMKTPGGFSR